MNREEEIRQAALGYFETNISGLTDMRLAISTVFEAGAEYADSHPAFLWHSVADGDEPVSYVDCLFYDGKETVRTGYMLDNGYVLFDDGSPMVDIKDAKFWMYVAQLLPGEEDKK